MQFSAEVVGAKALPWFLSEPTKEDIRFLKAARRLLKENTKGNFVNKLNARKHEVMKLLDLGYTNVAIAAALGVSASTVDRFVAHHWEWIKYHYPRGKPMKSIRLTPEDSQRIERLINAQAKIYHQELSKYYHVEYEDIRGELGVAVAEALPKYDPERSAGFDNLLRGAFRIQMQSYERRLLGY